MSATSIPKLPWTRVEGSESAFRLDKDTAYWKGQRGWWAQRPGASTIAGPFKGSRLAREWAEEPHLEPIKKKLAEKADREAARSARQEEVQAGIWGTLPPDQRQFQAGQVWAMKHPRYQDREALILDLRKDSVLALVRSGSVPWKDCEKDVRSHRALLHLYRFLRVDPVPKKHQAKGPSSR